MKSIGYVVETTDSENNDVTLNFVDAHLAEQVVRALVHSGYCATIAEEVIEINVGLANLKYFRDNERIKELEERKAKRLLGQADEESNMKIAHVYETPDPVCNTRNF